MAMRGSSQIRKGNDLMLFVETTTGKYEALAFATNHTLSISVEMDDVQTKDSGYNGVQLPKKTNWEIQSENLYIDGEFEKLYDDYVLKNKAVKVQWGLTTGADVKITADGTPYDKATTMHAPATASIYHGEAFISSLTANAQAGENATYSVTLTGSGTFEKKTA